MSHERPDAGTQNTEARSEAEMLATAQRWDAEVRAEATIHAWAITKKDTPLLDRALETLFRDETLTVEGLIRRLEQTGPDPAHWLVEGTVQSRFQRRVRREPPPVVEGSTVEVLLRQSPSSGQAAGFTRIPNWLLHGGIVARLERLAPGTTALVIVLLRYAERRDHEIRASKATLCRLTGIRKPETLDRRFWLLTRTNKAVALPALLRKLPGTGVHYAFRQDGLAALGVLARQTLEREERRLAAIRRAQGTGGQKGMQTRWGSGKASATSRMGSYQSAGKERGRITPHPSGTGRDK